MAERKPAEVDIFDTRRECLLASVADPRKVWHAGGILNEETECWGLANTEQQFRDALVEHLFTVERMDAGAIRAALFEELKETP